MIEEPKKRSTETSDYSTSEWLQERKRELDEVLDKKSRELSRRAQRHLARRMNHFEAAFRDASASFHRNDETGSASVVDAMADQMQRSADYLENTDPRELAEDGAERVREYPFVAFASALAAGLLLGRLITSSTDASAHDDESSEPGTEPQGDAISS